MIRFSEMKYERPDTGLAKQELLRLAKCLKDAASYDEAKKIFLEKDTLERHLDSMASLASIRHSINTKDSFYDEESSFWDSATPELEEALNEWNKALLETDFRKEFAEDFGNIIFINAEIQERSFDPSIVPLMQQENSLTTEYLKLLAGARIPFMGREYTIAQMGKYKKSPDDEVRLAAWKADGSWFREHGAELDEIYDRLVKLRTEMSRRLGLKDAVESGYLRMMRNCYDREDVDRFREAVIKYLVPVAEKIRKRQAERTGAEYPMSFSDNELMFRSGNPVPAGGAEDILEAGRRMYDAISPETREFFNMMLEGELMDVLSKEGKEGGGYCTSIYDYDAPFIFANFNGTTDDVETVTHEAGHAFADWLNRKRVPAANIWPTMEACEVHSMSMEFFAWRFAEDFFGADARKYLYNHLAGALLFIPYGTMVDHFQHIVYEEPELTPEERHAEWKRLLGIYMPWLRLDGDIPVYSEGRGWQRQQHIYVSPFYYIDYCLAQTVALEFWVMIQDDPDAAWKRYMAYTEQGGTDVFTELLRKAGLGSPFDETTLRRVCERAESWLEKFDLTGIE